MSITSRPVSRRLLLQGLAGAGLAGTLFGAAGCTSAVQEARSQQAVQTGGPLRGGTINAGISEDLIPGNFFTNSTAGITTVIGLAFESLIRYPDDSVKPTPRLAERNGSSARTARVSSSSCATTSASTPVDRSPPPTRRSRSRRTATRPGRHS